MFRRVGIRGTLWLTSILLVSISLIYSVFLNHNLFFILWIGSTILLINCMDWANDKVAIGSADYLLSHREFGIPTSSYLPYPTHDIWKNQPERFVNAFWTQERF